MISTDVKQNVETKKWGYSIYKFATNKSTLGQTLKESEYKFSTEEEAKKECDIEFNKIYENPNSY